MSSDYTEYWLVSQAVPYFTRRLGERHEVSPLHGARMFQLLFAGGWEPTKVHYSHIPEAVWRVHEREAVARKIRPLTFEILPLITRLPDKRSDPECPEDSMIPVLFHTGDRDFIVPLICEPEVRKNGRRFLDIRFDHENEESSYGKASGKVFGEDYECGGEAFFEYLLPVLAPEAEETDFDSALREFLFDLTSHKAAILGSESLYRAWERYLGDLETQALAEEDFNSRTYELLNVASERGGPAAEEQLRREFLRMFKLGRNAPDSDTPAMYQRILRGMEIFLNQDILPSAPKGSTEVIRY